MAFDKVEHGLNHPLGFAIYKTPLPFKLRLSYSASERACRIVLTRDDDVPLAINKTRAALSLDYGIPF